MKRRSADHELFSSAMAVCAAVCASLASADALSAYRFDSTEAAFDATYAATPIDLTGTVVDEAGAPIRGAEVTAIGWGSSAANDGELVLTSRAGKFTMPALARRSVLLRVEAEGYYTEVLAVDLHRPLAERLADAGRVALTEKRPGRARLLVGGDTMLGRRFVDADGDGIEGEPGDLIRPATRTGDAVAVLAFLRDVLSSADYTQVNLESVVTTSASTPHPYKSYTFFSYPATIRALTLSGVDGVSLANNHVYDYLERGLSDTLSAVSSAGLDWFGAGVNETMAKGTVLYRRLGGGVDVAFQGFSQMVNDGTTLPEYTLVASDGPPAKGGALAMTTATLNDFMNDDAAGRFAIPVLHGGSEYSDYPTSGMRRRFTQLIAQGAGLVVAHHSHTAQGVALYDAGDGPRFVLMSLGNLVFDQDVFETFQSYVAAIDVDQTAAGVHAVRRVQLIPLHIEGYVPKLVAGPWLARMGRHVGHLSTTLPAAPAAGAAPDGLTGAVVFPSGARVVAENSAARYTTAEHVETLSVPLANRGTGPLAYARTSAADALAGLRTSAAARCDYGREIMLYGDFEDGDVDDEFHEGSMWSLSEHRYVQNSVVRSGIGAMVLLRKSTNTSSASTHMKNRVRFTPGNKLTLIGYHKGDNAGPLHVEVAWYTSGGSSVSSSVMYTRAAGTYDWERFTVDLTPPSSAGSVRVYFRGYAPASGEATTFLDDISLVEWEGAIPDASAGFTFATPNDWSFVRCTASATGLSSLGLSLTHRSYAAATLSP